MVSLRTGSRLGLWRDSGVQFRASGTSRERSGEEGMHREGVPRIPLASLAESRRSDSLTKFFRPRWEPVRRLNSGAWKKAA